MIKMRNYYRVMLGKSSIHANVCFTENFIGTDFLVNENLTGQLPEEWRAFNHKYIPIWQAENPNKSKIAAGLACGALWTVSKGIRQGDIVLCPDGNGRYRVGEVTSDYSYHPEGVLPHRRLVRWFAAYIDPLEMSQTLKSSSRSMGTVSNISGYHEEIEKLINSTHIPTIISTDETIEDPSAFALEKHLEDFLVQNWAHTDLGKEYDIYAEEGNCVGQQYLSDTGPIDILAVSKDKKRLLVIELKKGRASDPVIGQIQRYMGYVQEELAEDDQTVQGIIIALEDDLRIRRALAVTSNIEFYRYKISFKLEKSYPKSHSELLEN